MRVGVLGSGAVGRGLAEGIAAKGHEVRIGTEHPEKAELRELAQRAGSTLSIGSFADAAEHGELLLLCCLGNAVDAVIQLAGDRHFGGKVLIDVTNPLDFSHGMPPSLFVGYDDSLGERVQRRLPKARVVKCFNIVPNVLMTKPHLHEGQPTMIIAGNDPEAKATVAGLLHELGWEPPVDIGGIEGARWLEALVPLWVRVAASVGNFSAAFRLLKR